VVLGGAEALVRARKEWEEMGGMEETERERRGRRGVRAHHPRGDHGREVLLQRAVAREVPRRSLREVWEGGRGGVRVGVSWGGVYIGGWRCVGGGRG
jgi:hypothetical protein